jgi:hypothetical protein
MATCNVAIKKTILTFREMQIVGGVFLKTF